MRAPLFKFLPAQSSPRNRCLIRDCSTSPHARGLCLHHYQRARYLIQQGIETWENLEHHGLAQPRRFKEYGGKAHAARLRATIVSLHEHGIYPSAVAINRELGYRSSVLSSRDAKLRREIFQELGIEIYRRGPDISLK